MISLNLLPDVKKEYLKSQRTKRLVVTGSFLVSASSVAVVILMAMYVLGVQKLQISSSQDSIDKSILTLKETPDLAKVVSIQNQLSALPTLHEGKSAVTRLFGFLTVLTPSDDITLNSVVVDFERNSAEIKGEGKDFKTVNTFVDTIKNASYIYTDNNEPVLAFSNVVLDTIGKDSDTASFKIAFIFDPVIFDNTISGLKLSVPNITSTRSETEKPRSLFDSPTEEEESQ